jgi:hypothetical protein
LTSGRPDFGADPWRSPARLPFALDAAGERLGYLALDEEAYRAASFLDGRLLAHGRGLVWAPWREAMGGAAQTPGGCDFIFHIGHAGSTLVARLLGDLPEVFVLREPAILRDLAQAGPALAPYLDGVLKLLSRTWRPDQRSLVKATSFVNAMAPTMMSRVPGSKALLMFSAPQNYIAGLLAGEASRRDMVAMAPGRRARLGARLGFDTDVADGSEGETAAVNWACEILALADLAAEVGDRAMWVDFDRLLKAPRPGLEAILRHFRGEAPTDAVEGMLASPDFGRYAKDRRHAFDPNLRERVLAAARRDHAREIEGGLAWLSALGSAHPDFAQAARAAAAGRIV